jgi:GT2 family glycosyltransferase
MTALLEVSVVVPSFNRGGRIRPTLEALFDAEREGIGLLEIVVVDDGSDIPIVPLMHSYSVPDGVRLRCLTQANRGPAAARNAGFRDTSGDVVLFVDDDVILSPNVIWRHVNLHRKYPGSVIYGPCIPQDVLAGTPEYEACRSLWPGRPVAAQEQVVPVDIIASGQLSVERSMFADEGAVYRDELRTPGAEEFELTYRLRQRGIPILCAADAIAIHTEPIDIEAACKRQFKLALGTAEVLAKCPHVGEMPALNELVKNRHRITGTITRRIASSRIVRACALRLYRRARKCRLPYLLLRELYRYAVASWYIAGLRAVSASGDSSGRNSVKCPS